MQDFTNEPTVWQEMALYEAARNNGTEVKVPAFIAWILAKLGI